MQENSIAVVSIQFSPSFICQLYTWNYSTMLEIIWFHGLEEFVANKALTISTFQFHWTCLLLQPITQCNTPVPCASARTYLDKHGKCSSSLPSKDGCLTSCPNITLVEQLLVTMVLLLYPHTTGTIEDSFLRPIAKIVKIGRPLNKLHHTVN